MLDKNLKEKIIEKFKTHENDTGSTEVQIAILTEEIKQLLGHLKTHKKDNSSRRGLLRKVNERRRLLKYLENENPKSYLNIIATLKLKKTATMAAKQLAEEEDEVVIPASPVAE
ncbi:MAG TPA: 30S ribosomal protein S15 [Candidatus Magasanikbacteria bacterium]|nr:30S ribosomal protein S15 [Candidatus Magasanikbacteria bacterium]HBX16338.1 30S ribosomal protein S15 [Candidatus Magasanikbacteria bacterium]